MPNKDGIATLEDVGIDILAPASYNDKKVAMQVLEAEFRSQATKQDALKDEIETKFLEDYKRKVGYAAKVKKHDAAQAAMKRAEQEIEEVGLTVSGGIGSRHRTSSEKAALAVNKLRDQIIKATEHLGAPESKKNQALYRLQMCGTKGELNTIMWTFLGNGIIPPTTKKDLKRIAYTPE